MRLHFTSYILEPHLLSHFRRTLSLLFTYHQPTVTVWCGLGWLVGKLGALAGSFSIRLEDKLPRPVSGNVTIIGTVVHGPGFSHNTPHLTSNSRPSYVEYGLDNMVGSCSQQSRLHGPLKCQNSRESSEKLVAFLTLSEKMWGENRNDGRNEELKVV